MSQQPVTNYAGSYAAPPTYTSYNAQQPSPHPQPQQPQHPSYNPQHQPPQPQQQPQQQQYAYSPHPPQQQAMAAQPIIVTQQQQPALLIISGNQGVWPHYPVSTVCPHCGAHVQTAVRKHSGLLAWLACGGLALAGCIFGCCLIPFCIDGCLDTEHWCPSCHRLIAKRAQLDF